MNSAMTRGRRVLAVLGSAALAAGLAVSLSPAAATALPASASGDRPGAPAAAVAPAGARPSTLAQALPARLGTLSFTSVYGAMRTKSSSGKKLTVTLSASQRPSSTPTFFVSLVRGSEQHSWTLAAPNSSFKISNKGVGTLKLSSKKMGGLGTIGLKVTSAGPMKSQKCGGSVYSKTRNVKIAGTMFFNSGSSWGKVGSKHKPVTFKSTHRVYFSYDVSCPPVDYPVTCYNSLSWSTSRSTAKTFTYISARKDGARSAVYAYRTTDLAKPAGAVRSDVVSGTADAPVLTVAPDNSASMQIHGVTGSGTIASTEPGSSSDSTCDTGTQHTTYWFGGTVTNASNPVKVPAQAFGAFTVPNGTPGSMNRASFN